MLLAICFFGLCGAVIIPAITHLFTSQQTCILLDLYLEREHASGNKLSTSHCADSCIRVNPASVLSSAPSIRREPCACYMVTILWRCRLHQVLLLGCIVEGLQHTEMLVHCSGCGSQETTVLYLHWLQNTL